MPLKMKISDENNTTVLVWEAIENLEFFIRELRLKENQLLEIKGYSDKKKIEWLSTRYLLKLFLKDFKLSSLNKNKYGKPYLNDSDLHISISHSHSYASVILSDNVVGIDIQKIHPNIEKISHKFINPSELVFIEDSDKLIHMHILWGAKESMYKGYGKKELRFKEHMSLLPYKLTSGTTSFEGIVSKGDVTQNYVLKTTAINNYILVYAIKQ